jgi:ribose transport system permease protein
MTRILARSNVSRLAADYGMVGVLLLLCACCTVGTIHKQRPEGRQAARIVAGRLDGSDRAGTIAIVAEDALFAETLEDLLGASRVVATITGPPRALRQGLERLLADRADLDTVATSRTNRLLVEDVLREASAADRVRVVFAEEYRWPTFLTRSNLLNVANRNVVIAVLAVGMTMVIITGGIDLSVGSLVALSAVVAATLIAQTGGKQATLLVMIGASLGAIGLCAGVGGFCGVMISIFRIPPFVVTLAMMWVASGLAYIISDGKSIADVPEAYDWLGSRASLPGVPNTLVLMVAVYAIGHVVMSQTRLGRHIYAIGGNRLAARLSGIHVNRVLLVVYTISGAMAGIGGVMLASQFRSGVANYGRMYELYAIAAVVVGGTSLAGGEGKMLGTLIGVFVIAVVQNAMNLLEIDPYAQDVVLGLIVLAVVLLDMLKRHGWRRLLTPE